MSEELMNKVLLFIQKCQKNFMHNVFLEEDLIKAQEYFELLKQLKTEDNSTMLNVAIRKLDLIIQQINKVNYRNNYIENIVNSVSLSVTEYIINLIKEKHLTDPILISRYAYIELAKVLYYDISYVKQTNPTIKSKICNAKVNVKKEKMFSSVVCTQWLQLYTYILKQFGIDVIKRSIPDQDHVWGEIKLDDDHIIVVDATDYINSSIDLSNAKSLSPTIGFVILPVKYSNLKLYDILNNPYNKEMAQKVQEYYKLNREIDMTLGYITKKGYPIERIIKENELFQYTDATIRNSKDHTYFMNKTMEFFQKVKIPNNMDGYEIYAYYHKFIKQLPPLIRANITQKTIYVDFVSYQLSKLRKTFLHAPKEYLTYLDGLIYNKYYKYLSEADNNAFFEQIRQGVVTQEEVRDSIAKNEMLIAQINRSMNTYYAINKLQFYKPITCDTLGIQIYEPLIGTKRFDTQEAFEEFEKTIVLNLK